MQLFHSSSSPYTYQVVESRRCVGWDADEAIYATLHVLEVRSGSGILVDFDFVEEGVSDPAALEAQARAMAERWESPSLSSSPALYHGTRWRSE